MRRLDGARGLALALVLLFCGEACDEPGVVTPDLERMIVQDRYQAYDACELFPDGRAMRTPPENTVPRGGADVAPAVTRDLLARGQVNFQTYCAVCHGILGDGDAWVARKMSLRKPPSLIDPRVRAFPDSRIHEVIAQGYGLMRSYAEDLDPPERWAVVAYVRALQAASFTPLDALPPAHRARAEEELR